MATRVFELVLEALVPTVPQSRTLSDSEGVSLVVSGSAGNSASDSEGVTITVVHYSAIDSEGVTLTVVCVPVDFPGPDAPAITPRTPGASEVPVLRTSLTYPVPTLSNGLPESGWGPE